MTAPIQAEPKFEIEGVKELTEEEARAYFDAQARRLLGISGEEFLRRLDAGEFDELVDLPGPHGNLEMLSAIVR
jgi:hypothetical protein